MKKQIVVIHGGDTYHNCEAYIDSLKNCEISIERYKVNKDDWKPWLRQRLGEDYEVVLPIMPNKTNASFEEWKIWFEKIIPLLNDEIILIGHSLGASFVAKYLSENKFPKKLKGVFLVSGVFDKGSDGRSLASFTLSEKLNLQTEHIYLYHSKDDPVVPFSALRDFENALPKSNSRVFEDRKHINQPKFEELAMDILSLKD